MADDQQYEVVAVYAVDRVGLLPVGAYDDSAPAAASSKYIEVAAVADILAPSLNPTTSAPGSDASRQPASSSPEPGAIDARDCVRRQFLGKKVRMQTIAGRVVHLLRVTDNETVALTLVRRGLAIPREGIRDPAWRAALDNAAIDAKKQGRGRYSLAPASERARQITPFPAPGSVQERSLVASLVGAIVTVTVEEVQSLNRVVLVSTTSLQEFTMRIAGVGFPSFTDPTLNAKQGPKLAQALGDGKALLRRRLLHREVRVAIDAFDDTTHVFYGTILGGGGLGSSNNSLPHQNSESFSTPTQGPASASFSAAPPAALSTASVIVKMLSSGWAVVDRATLPLAPAPLELLDAELTSRSASRGIWAHVAPSIVEAGRVLDTDPFDGVVVEVHSPNTLTVTCESSGQPVDVVLAFVHQDPIQRDAENAMGTVVTYTSRWLSARHFLRGLAMGQRVRCVPITAPPGRLTVAQVSLVDEAGMVQNNLTSSLAAAGLCELAPLSLKPAVGLQLNPPPELVAVLPSPNAVRVAPSDAFAGDDDSDGDIPSPVVTGKATPTPLRATPGRMTKTVPARLGVSPDLSSSQEPTPVPLFDDPFANARAAFGAPDASPAAPTIAPAAAALPPGRSSDVANLPTAQSQTSDAEKTRPVKILFASRHPRALARLAVPLGEPLVGDVEAVDPFGVMLCLLPAQCVAVPVTLASVAFGPTELEEAVGGIRLNLLHRRVTLVVSGLALSGVSFAAVVSTPSVPSVSGQLVQMGLGIVSGVAESPDDFETAALRAAEASAREERVGVWHPDRAPSLVHLQSQQPAAGVLTPSEVAAGRATLDPDSESFIERASHGWALQQLGFSIESQVLNVRFLDELDMEAAFAALCRAAEAVPFMPLDEHAKSVTVEDLVAQPVLVDRALVWGNNAALPSRWCRGTILNVGPADAATTRVALVRFVDFGDVAALPLESIRIVDSTAINAADATPTVTTREKKATKRGPKDTHRRRKDEGAAAAAAAAGVVPNTAAPDASLQAQQAEAISILATTPALVCDVRLAFVTINVKTPVAAQIMAFMEAPAGVHPIVEYVWDGLPHVSLYASKAAFEAGEPSLSTLLVQHTLPGEVDVDLRLLDQPQLAPSVQALSRLTRGVPFIAVEPAREVPPPPQQAAAVDRPIAPAASEEPRGGRSRGRGRHASGRGTAAPVAPRPVPPVQTTAVRSARDDPDDVW